jgi:hypothetical protein
MAYHVSRRYKMSITKAEIIQEILDNIGPIDIPKHAICKKDLRDAGLKEGTARRVIQSFKDRGYTSARGKNNHLYYWENGT